MPYNGLEKTCSFDSEASRDSIQQAGIRVPTGETGHVAAEILVELGTVRADDSDSIGLER